MPTGHGHFSSAANLGVSDKLILNSFNLLLLLKTWTSSKGITGVGEDSKLVKGEVQGLCRAHTRCVAHHPTLGLHPVATHQGGSDGLEELLH